MGAIVIDARNPAGFHDVLLQLGVLAPVALNFDDQVQEILRTVTVVDQYNEVRQIAVRLAPHDIGDFQTEVVVLGVRDHAGMGFDNAAELAFPATIEDYIVDVAFAWVCLPEVA